MDVSRPNKLGWKSKIDLDLGIKNTIKSLKRKFILSKNFLISDTSVKLIEDFKKKLVNAFEGELLEPFQAGEWWIIIKLLGKKEANLNHDVKKRIFF